METKFQKWLKRELKERDMIQAELARRANVSRASITKLLSENRTPSYDMCQGIADAFEIPVENVYRAADLLPPVHPEDAIITEMLHLFEQLNMEGKEDVRDYMRMKIEQAKRRKRR